MMAHQMYNNMQGGGMPMMGNMQINPAQMAQFQAMQQQRQLAARQVGLASGPSVSRP